MIIQIFSMLHQQESLIYMIQRERVSAKVAQTFIKWDGRNKEEWVGRAGGDQDSAGSQQEALNSVTGRMLDAQVGRISWSLWNEKLFPEQDIWRPSTNQLRRWKARVAYTYASFGEEVARHPIWLLKSFEATITPKWCDWLEKYRYSKTLSNPNYKFSCKSPVATSYVL